MNIFPYIYGGCWSDDPRVARVASGGWDAPYARGNYLGLRLVRNK